MSQKLLEVLWSLLSTNETGTVNTLSLTGSQQPAHITSWCSGSRGLGPRLDPSQNPEGDQGTG